jgi:hypothetical protein
MDRALTLLLEHLAREKFAATTRPRERGTTGNERSDNEHPSGGQDLSSSGSRTIPAEVRRAVWLRDGARCAFIASNGHWCSARALLEFHHMVPYAAGGAATVDNIQLRCRAHNKYEADLYFGHDWPRPSGLPGTSGRTTPSIHHHQHADGEAGLRSVRAGPG